MDLITYLKVGLLLLDDTSDEIELHASSYSRLVENSSYSSYMLSRAVKGGKPESVNISF